MREKTMIKVKELTGAQIQKICEIEGMVYPSCMRSLEDIESPKDLLEYCESKKAMAMIGEDWYLLATPHEVVDLACTSSLSLEEINQIFNALKAYYGTKKFTLDARKTTSYRLLKVYASRGRIKIHSEEEWYWDDEVMCEMTLSFIL